MCIWIGSISDKSKVQKISVILVYLYDLLFNRTNFIKNLISLDNFEYWKLNVTRKSLLIKIISQFENIEKLVWIECFFYQ